MEGQTLATPDIDIMFYFKPDVFAFSGRPAALQYELLHFHFVFNMMGI